jgi:hypothetical protein
MGGVYSKPIDYPGLSWTVIANYDQAGTIVSYTIADPNHGNQPLLIMEPAEFSAFANAPYSTQGWYLLSPQWGLDIGSGVTYAGKGDLDKAKENYGYVLTNPDYWLAVALGVATGLEGGVVRPSSAIKINTSTTPVNSQPLALGLSEYLDDFANMFGADTWKNFPNPNNWKSGVLDALNDPSRTIYFNLDGVDVWAGVQRAASGRGGATDWELLQIKQNPQSWDRVQFWKDGQQVPNPFK